MIKHTNLCLDGESQKNKSSNLNSSLKRQQNIFRVVIDISESTICGSYKVSEILAKHSRPFTYGKHVKES